jgi:aspartyl-tRNA(Asn)/glutamyl-tRNA(Gln) amidotransferase subunit B
VGAAAQRLFPALMEKQTESAEVLAQQLDLIQNSDSGELAKFVEQVLANMPEKVAEYKGGKVGLIGLFVGEVMKLSKGKADPKIVNTLVKESLDKA